MPHINRNTLSKILIKLVVKEYLSFMLIKGETATKKIENTITEI